MNAPAQTERVSLREYARRRSCSPSYVHKLVHAGTIPRVDGLIDAVAADAILAARADPGRVAGSRERKARAQRPANDAASGVAELDKSWAKDRSEKAQLENALLRIKLDQERGKLIEREGAVRLIRDLASGFGKMIEQYPDRVAAQIAAQLGVEPHKCGLLLKAMAKGLRDEFATLAASLPDSVTGP